MDDRGTLEELGRQELIDKARDLRVERPEVMTRVELVDEIVRLTTPDAEERRRARGWLGVARDLIASVVEQGLNLPDAAALIRGGGTFGPLRPPQRPVATVTLAEIYAAQGHHEMAVKTLEEVLAAEPDHDVARRLLDELSSGAPKPPAPKGLSLDARIVPAAEPTDVAQPAQPTDAGEAGTDAAKQREVDAPDDAMVVAVLERGRTFVYWEMGPTTRTQLAAGERPRVRLVGYRPHPDGAERVEQEITATEAIGSVVVDGFAGAVVRGALGIDEAGRFRPLAVAIEVTPAGDDVAFNPRPRIAFDELAQRAAAHLAQL